MFDHQHHQANLSGERAPAQQRRQTSSLVWLAESENFCANVNSERILQCQRDLASATMINQPDSPKPNRRSDLHCSPNQSTLSELVRAQVCTNQNSIGSHINNSHINNSNSNNSNNKPQVTYVRKAKVVKTNMNTNFRGWKGNLLNLIVFNIILSQLNENLLNYLTLPIVLNHHPVRRYTKILFADALECSYNEDCVNADKICHENKCICAKERPIDGPDGCLTQSYINDQCFVNEQCLGNSLCVGGTCSCGEDEISLWNPSSKLFYCHPKRRLNEECNYDQQCPTNSYCSTSKSGCLCQNGYSPGGPADSECVEKSCSNSSSCESEFHQCDDNKCKCLATHFDPTTARCYKFGSTGGKASDGSASISNSSTGIENQNEGYNFHSILKDLTENSDRMWLVIIILITSSIVLFVLIFLLIRKYCIGYCWTAHKKEYEPNNKVQPKNGYFNKNSINNKSFRQKNGETDDGDPVDDKNDSTAFIKPADKNHSYVRVNVNQNDNSFNADHRYNEATSPLKTSTSTPV